MYLCNATPDKSGSIKSYHIIWWRICCIQGSNVQQTYPKKLTLLMSKVLWLVFLGVVCCQYDISSKSTHCCDMMCMAVTLTNQHQESTPRLAKSVTSALVTVAPLAISQLTAAVFSKSRACHLGLCIPKNWTNHNSTSWKNRELGDILLLNSVAGWCHLNVTWHNKLYYVILGSYVFLAL